MSCKIAIASGKGGTGKTTLAVNLFSLLRKRRNRSILVDCDVEEPNDILFFADNSIRKKIDVFQKVPEINKDLCTYCRKCVEYCEFNAIVVIPPVEFAEVNRELCHSCGACSAACEFNAITEKPYRIGNISEFAQNGQSFLMEGKLRIGSAMQTMMIRELKKNVPADRDLIIYDAPPGTSCPVVETISDADYVILVSEPTPFGLHDLKLMVALLKEMTIPFGLVINKAGLGNEDIYEYLQDEDIELLGEIPFSKEYAGKYSRGELLTDIPEEIKAAYRTIYQNLGKETICYEGTDNS